MKKTYVEEPKTSQTAQLNSPKSKKEDQQISVKSAEKKLLPQDVVKISSNQAEENQILPEIHEQYKTYNQLHDQLLVSNIQKNLQEAQVSYAEAQKLYADIYKDITTATASMQTMQNQLTTCAFQRQLGQITDKQAQEIIYGILPGSVEGIELLETTAQKLNTLETICSKLNSLAGDMPEYNIAQFSIEYTKSSIEYLRDRFQENLDTVDNMENQLQQKK
ncbi:hypothetical protein Trichorick_00158 [Candidatus Trichorickettsia mobilis]|uniref:Uncharacterized protein n=1 Tax=Candidatus Trichorickettsia mobilis TaxID=1346319 RepID=A0ABZ0URP9_9RICK|nr:hypothetical protein [Candidatus Trichorickettsia mobilis]WPY00286.1 hypothetical protein Trichorick_00158 [Candidatus Trichorickettsia mobilis]